MSKIYNRIRYSYYRICIHNFLAWLYIDKKWGYNPYISWIFISLDKIGIDFPYKGDTVIWLWPWRRKNTETKFHKTNKYVSTCCEGYFNSLKEMDQFWYEIGEASAKFGPINIKEFDEEMGKNK